MREFLAAWIVFQLIVIGAIGGSISYEVLSNGCVERTTEISEKWKYELAVAVFPLTVFIAEPKVCE